MSKVKIYHNPRCSKSRQTLELLQDQGLEVEVIEYLKTPPSAEELDTLYKSLEKEPIEVMRTKEEKFKELGLSMADNRSRLEWLKIMSENPVLIERPIVVNGSKVALGRPPESVLEII